MANRSVNFQAPHFQRKETYLCNTQLFLLSGVFTLRSLLGIAFRRYLADTSVHCILPLRHTPGFHAAHFPAIYDHGTPKLSFPILKPQALYLVYKNDLQRYYLILLYTKAKGTLRVGFQQKQKNHFFFLLFLQYDPLYYTPKHRKIVQPVAYFNI